MAESISLIESLKNEHREFSIDRGRAAEDSGFSNNSISTSRYSLISFLPRNLFHQFHRIGNVWFLLVSILQILPYEISPTSSWSTIAPLCFVLFITMAKDSIWDYQRHKADQETNNRLSKIWSEKFSQFIETSWKEIEVGNILLVTIDELVPADCILLRASTETCYLETSSLDGEDNLKVKLPVAEIASLFDGESAVSALAALHYLDDGLVKTEQSNNRLYSFSGSIKLKNNPRKITVLLNNVILRGSRIKNTEWAICLVTFTGNDTKLLQNTLKARIKRSKIERKMNSYLIICFFFMSMLIAICSFVSIIEVSRNSIYNQFITKNINSSPYLVILTFIILFNRFIPISLYVTIDILKILQSKFMTWDLHLYCETTERSPVVKNTDLLDELGQIEYIFADKTGTLTYNQMEFKKCSIKGIVYDSLSSLKNSVKTNDLCDFLEILSLCHTVIPEDREGTTYYEAASQDEEALVQAAKEAGYKFISNSSGYYILNIDGENLDYRILGINSLTSERKRMSVVVEPMSDRNRGYVLYCKGADSVMLERCKGSRTVIDKTIEHLQQFAEDGLRTLVLAKRELSMEEAEEFKQKYITAKNALYNKEKRLEDIAEAIEQDMEIVGVSAVEDMVHEGVSDTLCSLMRAGIKVLILTGDKSETAVNIAYSTKLFSQNLQLITINSHSPQETENLMLAALNKYLFLGNKKPSISVSADDRPELGSSFERIIIASELKQKKDKLCITPVLKRKIHGINVGLVVDGLSLSYIMSNTQMQRYLILLISISQSGIFGRVSPKQKAQLVKLVKNSFSFKPCTLAVGDGANDVAMLQEANVGIGIIGNEGSQAINSSDIAIAKFQYLDKLILYQGRWNYYRTTTVVFFSIYKNFVFSLPLFYYSFYSWYSGIAIYDSILISVYNIIYTSIPILILGAYDKDMSRVDIYRQPFTYIDGIYNQAFKFSVLLLWILRSCVHSLVLYFFIIISSQSIGSNGYTEDIYSTGTALYLGIVFTVNTVLVLAIHEITLMFALSVLLSCGLLIPFLLIYNRFHELETNFNMTNILTVVFSFKYLITAIFLCPIICSVQCLLFQMLIYQCKQKKIRTQVSSLYQEGDINRLMLKRAAQYRKDFKKIYCQKPGKAEIIDEETDSYSLSHYTLTFLMAYVERSYMINHAERNPIYLTKLLKSSLLIYTLCTILELSLFPSTPQSIALRVLMFLLLLLGILAISLKLIEKHYNTFTILLTSSILLTKFIDESSNSYDCTLGFAFLLPILYFFLHSCIYKLLICTSIYLIAHTTRISVLLSTSAPWLLLHYLALLPGFFLLTIFIGYSLEKCNRLDYVFNKKLEYKFQKGHDILGHLLPGFVKERVKQGIRYIADYQSSVTVLFCDICDFDTICAMHSPNELLELLDRFFGILDQLCDKHSVTKIETVNKTYMVCGGLKDSEEQLSPTVLSQHHASRCLDLAIEIIQKIQQVYLKTGEKLKVKIGINTGPVIAGVVGEHKPQFSLVGDTVNTASRMCTTLEHSDSIQISESTHKNLGKKYKMQENTVLVKGKGETHTYIVSAFAMRNRERRMATIEKFRDDNDLSDRTVLEISHSENFQDAEIEKFPQALKVKLDNVEFLQDEDSDIDLVGPVQWLVCSFYESKAQAELRSSLITMKGKHLYEGIIFFTAFYAVISVVFILDFVITERLHVVNIGARGICICLLALNAKFFRTWYKHPMFPWFVVTLYTLLSLISTTSIKIVTEQEVSAIVFEKMYIFIMVNHMSGLLFGYILGSCMFDLFTLYSAVFLTQHSFLTKLSVVFILSLFYGIQVISSLMIESQERKRFNINKYALQEIRNTEKLLNQMIPSQVLRNLHHDTTTTDRYLDVTIIYADICGFTSWSSKKEPIEVVSMLNKLFSNFDHLCVRHNVYKVHTIGDCYVILSFTDGDRRDIGKECLNMVEIALDMIKTIQKVNKRQKTELNMRIGMHTGEVIAGITGTNIVRYDIYGADVEIANKVESNGSPGKINISQVTKDLLEIYQPTMFEFVPNKMIEHDPTGRKLESCFLTQKLLI